MVTGTVLFFDEKHKFGFIKEDKTGEEYYVYITDLLDKVKSGDKVIFNTQEGRMGHNALNVQLAKHNTIKN